MCIFLRSSTILKMYYCEYKFLSDMYNLEVRSNTIICRFSTALIKKISLWHRIKIIILEEIVPCHPHKFWLSLLENSRVCYRNSLFLSTFSLPYLFINVFKLMRVQEDSFTNYNFILWNHTKINHLFTIVTYPSSVIYISNFRKTLTIHSRRRWYIFFSYCCLNN